MQCRYLPSKGKNLRRERLAVCKGKDFAKEWRKEIHPCAFPSSMGQVSKAKTIDRYHLVYWSILGCLSSLQLADSCINRWIAIRFIDCHI